MQLDPTNMILAFFLTYSVCAVVYLARPASVSAVAIGPIVVSVFGVALVSVRLKHGAYRATHT